MVRRAPQADEERKSEWRVIGTGVRGAAHVRAGLPNQDAIRWLPESAAGPPLILAVSDGHGSAKCFRSNEGAIRAVEAATTVIQDFLEGQPDLANLSAVKRTAEDRLPQSLAYAWKDTVEAHLAKNPFVDEEWARVVEKDGPAAQQAVETNPLLAYGATLLAVLVAESFVVYLQLGDGDILTVSETGEVSRPLPRDERLFANETTSLCSRNAWRDFQVRFQVLSGRPPVLILLSTDGYANSFRDEEGFLKVGSDLLEMIRSDSLDKVKESLETWLTEASQVGSGDDITLGLICRMDALNKFVAETLQDATPGEETSEQTP